MQKAVIIFGPPGAGKGTQAEMLADRFGFLHLETSRIIEEALRTHEPSEQIIPDKPFTYTGEKDNFDKGILVEPEVVVYWMAEAIRRNASAGRSVVFSGSPRTLFEAEQLHPVLRKSFSPGGIICFYLSVPPELSVARNKVRRICAVCRLPHRPDAAVIVCLRCGGELATRGRLDSEESLRTRLKEFEERTMPGIHYLTEQGIVISHINGAVAPEEIFSQLQRAV